MTTPSRDEIQEVPRLAAGFCSAAAGAIRFHSVWADKHRVNGASHGAGRVWGAGEGRRRVSHLT